MSKKQSAVRREYYLDAETKRRTLTLRKTQGTARKAFLRSN